MLPILSAFALVLLAIAIATPSASALSLLGGGSQPQLLEPADAFATRARATATTVTVEIDIANGYYLYGDKFNVSSSDNVSLGSPELPAGKLKHDEFFGDVITHRGPLKFTVPLRGAAPGDAINLAVQSQGCADVGVCYPPYSKSIVVAIPASESSTPATPQAPVVTQPLLANKFSSANSAAEIPATRSPLDALLGGSSQDDQVLDPEQAFVLQPAVWRGDELTVSWQIADGHYLYRDKFNFELTEPTNAAAGAINISPGKLKTDEFFGEVEVHRTSATARLEIQNAGTSSSGRMRVTYQGCADIGICYPPQQKVIDVPLLAAATGAGNSGGSQLAAIAKPTADSAQPIDIPQQDRLASHLAGGNKAATIATFFGLGLLLAFTPCVLPMVPILSSIIVGDSGSTSTRRAFTLSLIYVLAMALTYTVVGVIVGLTGENLQATFQNPWIVGFFALVFVVLAASMFGLYELRMPTAVQQKLTGVSNRQQSNFAGVALMGFLSALIVGPCVTAPLVGALIYIGQTGDAVLGGAALFTLSMGMGVPLLLVGTTFGKYLPRSGPWMTKINAVFGVLLLAVAIWLLERVVPDWAVMLMAALLLITVGVFMGALDSAAGDTARASGGWPRLSKGFGFAALLYGSLLIIGVASGRGSLLQPLRGLALAPTANQPAISASADHSLPFQPIKGVEGLQLALAQAASDQQPVMLDFYADWCISCKEMEAFTFTDPGVQARLENALLLQADVTKNDQQDKMLLKNFGLFGPPAILFYNARGEEQRNARVVGFLGAEDFSSVIDRALR